MRLEAFLRGPLDEALRPAFQLAPATKTIGKTHSKSHLPRISCFFERGKESMLLPPRFFPSNIVCFFSYDIKLRHFASFLGAFTCFSLVSLEKSEVWFMLDTWLGFYVPSPSHWYEVCESNSFWNGTWHWFQAWFKRTPCSRTMWVSATIANELMM